MCKLSSLFFSFACHWLHVLYWCLVPGTWPSCLWKEALQLACLIRRKKSFLGLVTPQKPMVMFHCTLCPHYLYLYVCLSIYLYKDWHIMYLCIYLHVRALLLLLLVQCPLHALKIISCSANQSLANVFKIVCHLQISSNMSWKCFTSSSKMTYQISMFWCFGFFFFSWWALSGLKILIMNVSFSYSLFDSSLHIKIWIQLISLFVFLNRQDY